MIAAWGAEPTGVGGGGRGGPVTWGYPTPPPVYAVQPIGPSRELRLLNEFQVLHPSPTYNRRNTSEAETWRMNLNSLLLSTVGVLQPPPSAPVAEHPAHVLVRVWRYDHTAAPEVGPLQMVVHNATLCSEMGVHISPCGKMLALCVAVSVSHSPLITSSSKDKALLDLVCSQVKGMPPFFTIGGFFHRVWVWMWIPAVGMACISMQSTSPP